METQNRKKKKSPPEESSSETSIDDLPADILTHILSYLPTTAAAARTSAVAPPWRNLWQSIPVISFVMQAFHRRRAPDRSIEYTCQLFAEMLSQMLLQRPRESPVEKFKLFFAYHNHEHIRRYVDSWLKYVIGLKAVELDLNFRDYIGPFVAKYDAYQIEDSDEEEMVEVDEDASESESEEEIEGNYEDAIVDLDQDYSIFNSYQFHYSDLVNSSVSVVKLFGIDLRMPRNMLPIKIYSLREMHLQVLSCTGNEIAHLLASCVNLEILSLVSVDFSDHWKIESQSLKHFKFRHFDEYYESVEADICALNLESLSLWDAYNGMYSLKDSSSLVAADVKFPSRYWRDFVAWRNLMTSLGGVERLAVENMWSLSMPYKVKKRPLGRTNWNHVKLAPDKVKKRPLGRANWNRVKKFFSETFMFHNLKQVEMLTGYSEYDILGLEILLSKCPQLETMVLVRRYNSSDDDDDLTGMPIVLQMPHLRLVEMKKFRKTRNELFVAGLLKKHGIVLDKIVAYPKGKKGEPVVSFVVV